MNAAVVVDIGNTRIKWGRCNGDRVEEMAFLPPEPEAWARQLEQWRLPPSAPWVVSGVHPGRYEVLVDWLRQRLQTVTPLNQARSLPLRVRLEFPERAGMDRLLNAVAVNTRRRPGVPAVIVDAGSAVTVDWLDETGAFCGGAILPGLRLMAKALHDYTALLPLIELHAVPPPWPGTSTTAALEVGIFWSVAAAIRTLAAEFARGRSDRVPPELYLAGGDGPLLQAAVGAEAILWPEITLEGVRVKRRRTPVTVETLHPTWQACLTPPGVAALATLAVPGGPQAWTAVRSAFDRTLPETPEPGRFWLGRFGNPTPGGSDEVVLAVLQGLPQPVLEIHCHGGRQVVAMLQEILAAQGVQLCSPPELNRHTAEGDRLARQALEVLPQALTARTARIVLDQHAGALTRVLEGVEGNLERGNLAAAERLLGEVTKYTRVGRHLTKPWQVAIAGATNAGKSSLVNALLGYERSVVSATPGTMRDLVTSWLVADGWPVELTDTPGWRTTADALEQQGQQAAATLAGQADLVLWLLDGSEAPHWPAEVVPGLRYVITKVDLPAAWDHATVPATVRLSALTGSGIGELCAALAAWLIPETPPPGAAVPFTSELAVGLEGVQGCCARGDVETARQLVQVLRQERD